MKGLKIKNLVAAKFIDYKKRKKDNKLIETSKGEFFAQFEIGENFLLDVATAKTDFKEGSFYSLELEVQKFFNISKNYNSFGVEAEMSGLKFTLISANETSKIDVLKNVWINIEEIEFSDDFLKTSSGKIVGEGKNYKRLGLKKSTLSFFTSTENAKKNFGKSGFFKFRITFTDKFDISLVGQTNINSKTLIIKKDLASENEVLKKKNDDLERRLAELESLLASKSFVNGNVANVSEKKDDDDNDGQDIEIGDYY